MKNHNSSQQQHNIMSHWSDVVTEFTSLEFIESALTDLGTGKTRLLRDEKTAYGYGRNSQTCDAVIRGGLHYDVAVHIKDDGMISLTTDFYPHKNGGVKNEQGPVPVGDVLGRDFTKLKAYYAAHKSYATAKKRGVKSAMHRINEGVHQMKNSSGKWTEVNSSMWSRIKKMLPFRDIKQENTNRLWVQCEIN
jgi:hypothetical protein